mmetsp:Transcript_126582/g.364103  ORF Transcript_126582/g.364103 Transcript_126582/m.364103 type:complete len:246 (-) Transcript_126582:140-877(-)
MAVNPDGLEAPGTKEGARMEADAASSIIQQHWRKHVAAAELEKAKTAVRSDNSGGPGVEALTDMARESSSPSPSAPSEPPPRTVCPCPPPNEAPQPLSQGQPMEVPNPFGTPPPPTGPRPSTSSKRSLGALAPGRCLVPPKAPEPPPAPGELRPSTANLGAATPRQSSGGRLSDVTEGRKFSGSRLGSSGHSAATADLSKRTGSGAGTGMLPPLHTSPRTTPSNTEAASPSRTKSSKPAVVMPLL